MAKRTLVLALCMIVMLTGCSNIKALFKDEEVRYSSLPAESLYIGQQAIIDKTKDMISSAEMAIFIEQKLFKHEELFNLILQKAKAGVEVRILLNQSATNREILERFKSNNISAHFYPIQKGQTNNVKILVVDYSRAMVYGSTWTEEGFASQSLAVELTGKAAQTATTVFNRDWRFTTTLDLNIPKSEAAEDDYITLATNTKVKSQLLSRINSSTTSIMIEVEEITDVDIINALIEARSRGIEVRIILNAENQRRNPTPNTLAMFKEAGIEVLFYDTTPQLARNLALFDETTFIFSSSGWTYSAFVLNHEFSITVPSPEATAHLSNLLAEDWGKSVSSI